MFSTASSAATSGRATVVRRIQVTTDVDRPNSVRGACSTWTGCLECRIAVDLRVKCSPGRRESQEPVKSDTSRTEIPASARLCRSARREDLDTVPFEPPCEGVQSPFVRHAQERAQWYSRCPPPASHPQNETGGYVVTHSRAVRPAAVIDSAYAATNLPISSKRLRMR
jgi:hypothetical protein